MCVEHIEKVSSPEGIDDIEQLVYSPDYMYEFNSRKCRSDWQLIVIWLAFACSVFFEQSF